MMFVLSQIKNFLTSYQQLFLPSSYFNRMSSSLGRLNFFLLARYFLLVAFGSLLFASYFLLVSFCSLLVTFCSLLVYVSSLPLSFWSFLLVFRFNYAPYILINFKVVLLFCPVTISKNIMMIRNYFIFINFAQTDDISNHNYLSKGISAP